MLTCNRDSVALTGSSHRARGEMPPRTTRKASMLCTRNVAKTCVGGRYDDESRICMRHEKVSTKWHEAFMAKGCSFGWSTEQVMKTMNQERA